MKKIITISLACIILLTSLSACDADEASNGPITLTLACWIKDFEIQELVSRYNSSQSEYEIEILDYFDSNSDFDTAYTRMMTQLITGDTPDIFYLDSMEVMSLINAGLLADLYPFMESDADFNEDDYYTHIMSLFEYNGALYELIPCFKIGAVYGAKSVLGDRTGWTVEEFEAFADSLDDTETAIGANRVFMLAQMVQFGARSYIDVRNGTCNFDSEEFVRFLELAAAFPEESDYYSGLIFPDYLGSVYEYASHKSQIQDSPVYVGYPGDYASGPCAMALCSFGIASTTEYPDACWDFMKLLLAEDQQTQIMSSMGFPIRRSVLEDQLERAVLDTGDPNSLLYGYGDENGKYPALTGEEADYLRNLIENLSDVRFRYTAVLDIIVEESEVFFAGDITAERAAEIIQSRVGVFLAERS